MLSLCHSPASGRQLLTRPTLCFRTPFSLRKELFKVSSALVLHLVPWFLQLLLEDTSTSPGSGGQWDLRWWASQDCNQQRKSS